MIKWNVHIPWICFFISLTILGSVGIHETRMSLESKQALMFRAMELSYNGTLDIDDLINKE